LCTDASVSSHERGGPDDGVPDDGVRSPASDDVASRTGAPDAAAPQDAVVGDPTEVALVRWGLERDVAKPALEDAYPRVGEVPFDSARKRMTTVHRAPDGGLEIATKGGVDEVLAVCA